MPAPPSSSPPWSGSSSEIGAAPTTYHGTYFPNRLLRPTVGRLFAVGDAAGQCMPFTAEGIRPALYFGGECGKLVQQVIDGRLEPRRGARSVPPPGRGLSPRVPRALARAGLRRARADPLVRRVHRAWPPATAVLPALVAAVWMVRTDGSSPRPRPRREAAAREARVGHEAMRDLIARYRWPILVGAAPLFVGFCAWFVLSDASGFPTLVRLYQDKRLLKQTLERVGPPRARLLHRAAGPAGGRLARFPARRPGSSAGSSSAVCGGFIYSTIGLTLGSVVAFAIGRWLGAHFVRNLVSKETWERLGFIVEAEGAILCFIVYLIPGLPKDIVCYLFGISPMPLWVFALVSGLGRIPGTWILSAQGAHTAAGQYIQAVLIAVDRPRGGPAALLLPAPHRGVGASADRTGTPGVAPTPGPAPVPGLDRPRRPAV